MEDARPRMRTDLELFPVEHQGRQLVLIKDPLGLIPEGKAVDVRLFQLMALMDGTRCLRDLQAAWMRQQGGVLMATEELERLVSGLDASYLLDSEAFEKARGEIVAGFQSSSVRRAALSGRGYPQEPTDLKLKLNEILSSVEPLPSAPPGSLRALVAPHIDLAVGFRAYACAYGMLKGASPARVVVLGVGHQMQEGLYSLTQKDFETPLGVVPCDRAVVEKLRSAGQGAVSSGDWVHRSEHSIEFQLLFLQHILGDANWTLVPILCGAVQPAVGTYGRDAFLEESEPFLEALAGCLAETGQSTLLVAGVDLSHIGPKFGHSAHARSLEGQAEGHDRNLLDHLVQGRPEAFWEESSAEGDRFNVCGLSALGTLLEVLGPCSGKVLRYEMWHEEATRSAVSYAALAFTGP